MQPPSPSPSWRTSFGWSLSRCCARSCNLPSTARASCVSSPPTGARSFGLTYCGSPSWSQGLPARRLLA
eukprot:13540449-Alexandrium_andersonii.AAC.1